MGKKVWLVILVVAVVAAGLVAWKLATKPEEVAAPLEEPVVEEVVVVEAPVIEEAVVEEEPVAVEEVVAEEASEPAEEMEVALPEVESSALFAVPAGTEPEVLDEECRQILDAMKEKSGWDKIKTMKYTMVMDLGGRRTMSGDFVTELPKKMNGTFVTDIKGRKMTQYMVSDGVFMEVGIIGADGKKVPMKVQDYDEAQQQGGGMGPMFTGEMFDPATFAYVAAEDVTVDGSEKAFQKEDGTPFDNLDLKLLKGEKDDQEFEMFVDPESLEMKAMRIYKGGALLMECSGMRYEEVGEGVIYPVTYDMTMDMAAATGQAQAPKMEMTMAFTEIEINPEVDQSLFNLSGPAAK